MKFVKTNGTKVLKIDNVNMTCMTAELENNILVVKGFSSSGNSSVILTTKSDDIQDYIILNGMIMGLHPESIISYNSDTKEVTIYNANNMYNENDIGIKLYINEEAISSFIIL